MRYQTSKFLFCLLLSLIQQAIISSRRGGTNA